MVIARAVGADVATSRRTDDSYREKEQQTRKRRGPEQSQAIERASAVRLCVYICVSVGIMENLLLLPAASVCLAQTRRDRLGLVRYEAKGK